MHNELFCRWEWNQWLTLPVKYSDLPSDSSLCLTLYDCNGPRDRHPVGGTTLPLFGKSGSVYREGQIDLRIWNDVVADPKTDTSTPGKTKTAGKENLHRLSKLSKRYQSGKMPTVDWLDRCTFAKVEKINQKEKQMSNLLFLMVEFPKVHYHGKSCSIVYFEANGGKKNELSHRSDVVRVPDFDILRDNLVEAKHHRLARSLRAGQTDKDLKPNAEMRNRLDEIMSYPSTQTLTSEEADAVWRFRHYLSNNKKALNKFVKCINWSVKSEATQALDLVHKWTPTDYEDALELLGPSFKNRGLRQYAVNRLRQAPDAELQLFLLQLVQALKYEKISESWLKAEVKGKDSDSSTEGLPPETMNVDESDVISSSQETESDPGGGLAAFLIERACRNSSIANYLYWYLVIECEEPETAAPGLEEDKRVLKMYKLVMRRLQMSLKKGTPEMKERFYFLERQRKFVDRLVLLIKAVQRESGNRQKKIERLRSLLAEQESKEERAKFNFVKFEPLELMLDPDVKVCGLLPDRATLFKSSLMPAKLTFVTAEAENYVALFKHGDDLRQDQLILQIITLMNRILQQENLDLKLTPYSVLATSSKHGFVQFIESQPIADVLTAEGSIQNYFRKHNPSETGPHGIQAEVMDTYVKSCAGYCVITFILGVGDRHLDNLMITPSGKMFHIDFGYILGRDPKVLPPPMKLSKEMIDAFGGTNSDHYDEFRKQCFTAYLSLRRYSNLFLNLFSLMVGASVPDIALEPDKTVKKVQEKFRLDLNDEEAVRFMSEVIDVSAMAVMPAIVDRFHKLAQFLRN